MRAGKCPAAISQGPGPGYTIRAHRASSVARAATPLAYGFVEGPGRYETTLTRPDLFSDYYLEQFHLLRRSHGDDGSGVGASHQTGWTGLVAKLLQQSGE